MMCVNHLIHKHCLKNFFVKIRENVFRFIVFFSFFHRLYIFFSLLILLFFLNFPLGSAWYARCIDFYRLLRLCLMGGGNS